MTNKEFKEARLKLGFNQAEIAEALGLMQPVISKYEKDRAIPKNIEKLILYIIKERGKEMKKFDNFDEFIAYYWSDFAETTQCSDELFEAINIFWDGDYIQYEIMPTPNYPETEKIADEAGRLAREFFDNLNPVINDDGVEVKK